jgi:glycerol-3-phosphate dehydrogenase
MSGEAAAFRPDSRRRNIEALRSSEFDILIVGGGINGAGIARDLTLRANDAGRPLRVALIDKAHFSSGTSGRNSQLIHGGLRYLKNLEFGLVREALQERATLLRVAPHLVEPLALILPLRSWLDRRYYGAGLWLYDVLAGDRNIARRRYLSRSELARLEPGLSNGDLHSAAIFYDCRVHSARLLLENIFATARLGGVIANYVQADPWTESAGGFQVAAQDRITGERFAIRTRRLVDARGPWEQSGHLRLVRGSHIIVPRLTHGDHAVAYFGADGRIIFVIPWGPGNSLSLVGTTDVDHHGSPDDVSISSEEIRYLQDIIGKLFPSAGAPRPVAAYSSLRPLVAAPGVSATDASRSHRIWMEGGVLKIAGGKYTTYRAMAKEAVDLLLPDLRGRCRTHEVHLGPDPPEPIRLAAGEIEWAVRHEMAQRLSDVLFVSTYWGHERTLTAEYLRPLAERMGRELGWTEPRIEEEISLVLARTRMPI